MKINAEVVGSEEFSVLEGIVYYLSKEFDKIGFLSKQNFQKLKNSMDINAIKETKVFIEDTYIIASVPCDIKPIYVLSVIGEDLDLPKTYKILKKVKMIKEGV